MSSISGVYSPLPQSISDSDSEKEIQMDSLRSSNSYNNSGHSVIKLDNLNSKTSQDFQPTVIKPKMSPMRRVAFIFSITLCFLPIITFLWILPCNVDTCPVKISNWETHQEGIEIKGAINLFFEHFKKHFNIAVQYKGYVNSKDSLKHGLISFYGNNGGINWYFRQTIIPDKLDCSLLDVDLDGVPDCLLLDENGLKAVEVKTGQIIWHVHSHEEKTIIDNLQFPIILDDLNSDNVKELLSIYQKKYLIIICGRTGKALANIIVQQCNEVGDLRRFPDNFIFRCFTNGAIVHYQGQIGEVDNYLKTQTLNLEMYNFSDNPTNSFTLDNYKLNIANFGKFPDSQSVLKLFNKNKLVYSKTFNNSFIIRPSRFKFGSAKLKSFFSKGHTEGYVVKIWDWMEKFNPKRTIDYPFNFKRDSTNSTDFGNVITERVMLITFNSTDYNVIKASSINVTQLCFVSDNRVDCQPDIQNQEQSMLIYDLDRDGSQELIIYSSSFFFQENAKAGTDPWQLISTIKLLKLESELPKLYDARETFGIFSNY